MLHDQGPDGDQCFGLAASSWLAPLLPRSAASELLYKPPANQSSMLAVSNSWRWLRFLGMRYSNITAFAKILHQHAC